MRATGLDGQPRSLRRQRIAFVLVCWVLAGCLIFGQFLILRHLFMLNQSIATNARTTAQFFAPSDDWRLLGTFLPLLLMGGALTLQICWLRDAWRALSALAIVLFVPFSLLCLLLAAVRGPGTIESVRLSDGQRFILAFEPVMTDAVYTLYQEADPTGLSWRQVSWLDYSEDGRFTGREHLVLASDEHWLLVTRAGIWTDCFHMVGGRPIRIDVQPSPDWNSPDYEANMRLRSARIAALTGLRP
jgi:hypothetical protein